MKKNPAIPVYYTGLEYPSMYGREILIRDDFSTRDEKYEARFPGDKYFSKTIQGSEFSYTKPNSIISTHY
jgi:hypothetical protein